MSLFKKNTAQEEGLRKEDHIKKTEASVVCIRTETGEGAGFFIDYNGIIATNRHVVEGSTTVEVMFHDESTTPGRVVYVDPNADIAFVLADGKAMRPIMHDPAFAVEQGTDVLAIGHPYFLDYSVSRGIVSALARDLRGDGCTYIQIDVMINPGNSGGPLIDYNGRLVGMCSAGLPGFPGLNFAVPAEEIMKRYRSIDARLHGDEDAPSTCPFCSFVNKISDAYCDNCGAKLPYRDFSLGAPTERSPIVEMSNRTESTEVKVLRKCPSCGVKNKERSRYCDNCGFRLVKA